MMYLGTTLLIVLIVDIVDTPEDMNGFVSAERGLPHDKIGREASF